MAEIQPFKGWRYGSGYSAAIEDLISPLFDVVSHRQRAKLYENPINSIHLSVPNKDNPGQGTAMLLNKWKQTGILSRDPLPAIYVYYQYFTVPGLHRTLCRKGFICNIRIHEWADNVILRHENTMPGSVSDRAEILEATKMNMSPTHGLYTDESHTLEKYMEESMANPVYDLEDYQGVREVMSVIHDSDVIREFIRILKDKQVILADGHHRYEGALIHKNMHPESDAGQYQMMYLTNTESDDLVVLPTHRLVHGLAAFSKDVVMEKLAEYFTFKVIDEPHTTPEIIAGKEKAFGLVFEDEAWKLRLKPGLAESIPWQFDSYVKQLDITALHYFILDRAFGIPGKDHRTSPFISFNRSFTDCLQRVRRSEAQAAVITNEISVDEIKQVCYSGSVMPMKSTYFFPKAICGFVFSSIDDEEFSENHIACF